MGFWISENGVVASTTLSVSKKVGQFKHVIWEAKTVVEDRRNNLPVAFCTAIRLWEGSATPYLYSGVKGWLDIPTTTLKTLARRKHDISILSAP